MNNEYIRFTSDSALLYTYFQDASWGFYLFITVFMLVVFVIFTYGIIGWCQLRKKRFDFCTVPGTLLPNSLQYETLPGYVPHRGPETISNIRVTYTYMVDGRKYTNNRILPDTHPTSQSILNSLQKQIERIGNSPVTVYYESGHPKKSYLIKPTRNKDKIPVIVMLAFSCPFVFFFILYVADFFLRPRFFPNWFDKLLG